MLSHNLEGPSRFELELRRTQLQRLPLSYSPESKCSLGWRTGFEPATSRTTTEGSANWTTYTPKNTYNEIVICSRGSGLTESVLILGSQDSPVRSRSVFRGLSSLARFTLPQITSSTFEPFGSLKTLVNKKGAVLAKSAFLGFFVLEYYTPEPPMKGVRVSRWYQLRDSIKVDWHSGSKPVPFPGCLDVDMSNRIFIEITIPFGYFGHKARIINLQLFRGEVNSL